MRALRIVSHSFVLAVVNLGSIVIGFLAFKVSGSASQVQVQVPVATVLSVAGFLAWIWLSQSRQPFFPRLWSFLTIRDTSEMFLIYLMAVPCACSLFVFLHYFTQGYLTSANNLLVIAIFQLVVNIIGLMLGITLVPRQVAK